MSFNLENFVAAPSILDPSDLSSVLVTQTDLQLRELEIQKQVGKQIQRQIQLENLKLEKEERMQKEQLEQEERMQKEKFE